MHLFSDIVIDAAHNSPAAMIYGDDRQMDFVSLRDRAWRLANALKRIAEAGDRIAIISPNCPEYVEAYFGVPAGGFILTPLNLKLSPRELGDVLADCAPSVLMVHRRCVALIDAALANAQPRPRIVVISEDGGYALEGADFLDEILPVEPTPRPDPDSVCWLVYTSGATGAPKGVMLTHRNLLAAIFNFLATGVRIGPDDVFLLSFPMFHVAGTAAAIFIVKGCGLVAPYAFAREGLGEIVARRGVTTLALAPTMLKMVLDDDAWVMSASSVRLVMYGSAPMPHRLLEALRERCPGVELRTSFGMTELAGNVTALTEEDHVLAANPEFASVLSTVGRPMPFCRLRIASSDGGHVAAGETGEVMVKGDQVMVGYWRKPEETAAAFVDGWFKTGDLGVLDEGGRLRLVGRSKDVIISGGENIHAGEVEEMLREHAAVSEVAVLGLPDLTWGETVVAVLVAKAGHSPTAAEILSFGEGRIAGYKRPRKVFFIDELPKNAAGKVMKPALKAHFSNQTH